MDIRRAAFCTPCELGKVCDEVSRSGDEAGDEPTGEDKLVLLPAWRKARSCGGSRDDSWSAD